MDDLTTPTERLVDVARRQHGLFTHTDAVAAGLNASSLAARTERGLIERLGNGLYSVAGHAPSRSRDLYAALLTVGGEAALARRTAAEVHGLPVAREARVHVLVRDRSFHGTRQIAMHRTRWWDDAYIAAVAGLRTTTVARTIVDLAGSLSRFQLRKVVTHAVRHGQTDASNLTEHLAAAGRVRGAVQLREVIAALSPLEAQTASTLESMFLEVMTRAGLPPTALNHPVVDADGVQRYIDAIYLPEHVPVELDGERWHSLATDHVDDAARERAILRTGRFQPFLRFTFEDLRERPFRVVMDVKRALAIARLSP